MIAMHFSCSATEPPLSRDANTATAALPLIPRRVASVSRSRSAPSTPQLLTSISTPTPVKVIIQESTPPREVQPVEEPPSRPSDSDSGSSSSPSDGERPTIAIKGKRAQGGRSTIWPPEQSTPTPALYNARNADCRLDKSPQGDDDNDSTPRPSTRPLLYNPGVSLRLQTEGLKGRNFSAIHTHVRASTESPAPVSLHPTPSSKPQLVRKKSGQLVKSSLKTSKSLSVITTGATSKSEPATPTHAKVVHFDAQLEHVKLFLAEQKPLAVSRDGSPTEDTSGTDSDFPSFIFGDQDDAKPRKTLVMRLLNMPPVVNVNNDVALEELVLSQEGTSILGRVRVRNIAFAKWLTVRFTFDSWQTTSEVTGKWVESIDIDFDRFSFGIRLNDLLARIEGKRLYLAVKYTVAGKELWDNNAGQNYLASFTKVAPAVPKDDGYVAKSDIARLKSKLEIVAGGKEVNNGSSSSSQSSGRMGGQASRFTFKTDPDESWTPASKSPPPPRLRTQTYPATPTPSSVPWPPRSKMRDIPVIETSPQPGSPRDADGEVLFSTTCLPKDAPDETASIRNHRRGYVVDAVESNRPTVKKTVPGTPHAPARQFQTPVPASRFHSFPPREGPRPAPPYGLGFNSSVYLEPGEGSDVSTPSFTSPSSSSSPSSASSPSESFLEFAMTAGLWRDASVSPGTNYRHFINQFCFFTGSEKPENLNVPQDPIPRTQSASDIEEFLSTTSPKLHPSDSFYPTTPSRSPSFDDISRGATRSGSSTPTAHVMSASQTIVSLSPTILADSTPADA